MAQSSAEGKAVNELHTAIDSAPSESAQAPVAGQQSPEALQLAERVLIRHLGSQPYEPTLAAMRDFTDQRDVQTVDEIWVLEHPPVFTQGQAGKAEHLLAPGDIPVVKVDRGGQVTYHGPGQLVIYLLLNIKRLKLGVRDLVTLMEAAIVELMAAQQVQAYPKSDAPGVYVSEGKLASLGLRIRKGCCFHGLALNVDMDLEPFQRINPCGYPGLQMVQVKDLAPGVSYQHLQQQLTDDLVRRLGYNQVTQQSGWS